MSRCPDFYLCALCVLCGKFFFAFTIFGFAAFALTGFNIGFT